MNKLDEQRLRWRSRRGLLELDLLLKDFVAQHLPLLSLEEQSLYAQLLEWPDPELLELLQGQGTVDDVALSALIEKIIQSNTISIRSL